MYFYLKKRNRYRYNLSNRDESNIMFFWGFIFGMVMNIYTIFFLVFCNFRTKFKIGLQLGMIVGTIIFIIYNFITYIWKNELLTKNLNINQFCIHSDRLDI